IINLKTDRVPAPPSLIGAHIDQLQTETFFDTTRDGMLALDMEFIPQLSVIHLESLYRNAITEPFPVLGAPESVDADDPFLNIAQQWTAGIPEGWPQVKAICRKLQREYELDAEAMVPTDVEDAAVYFLQQAKRGPDYLFAASAATLLRRLGYETRVVSGFYVNPEHYDRQARVTSVYAEDAHFWIEVLVTSDVDDPATPVKETRHWIPVDPSPGYEVLMAPESLWSMLLARSALTWQVMKRSPIQCLVILSTCLLCWWQRAALGDFCVTSWWRLCFPFGTARDRVRTTLCLLERRARLYGRPRAIATPLGKWDLLAATRYPWGPRFVNLADWALYSDGLSAECGGDDVRAVCRTAASAFRLRRQKHLAVVNP
ncbi:MAG: transglutaminase-like domain-containing protein, partial [Planctomycetota bacterium]